MKYEKFTVLDDVSFNVKKGEVVGIIGKNGAGKSTLLKIISGVLKPTSGKVTANGNIVPMLELGSGFDPELTGRENIYLNGAILGYSKEFLKSKYEEIVAFSELGEFINMPIRNYSSGMMMRLAFSVATVVCPEILIVDEVLSVGDMAFQLKCFKKFQEFKEKGKTILFVTHSITEVLRNCTRTIIIDGGRKIFDGDLKEGVEKYKKIIVGLSPEESVKNIINEDELLDKNANYQEGKETSNNEEIWKTHFNENPELITYGNGDAEVIDYGIFDTNNHYNTVIENDKDIILKSKIVFHKDVKDPIFTMSLKDFKGLEICGTNTLFERIITGEYKKGDVVTVEFKQKLNVAAGQYTLSFSCTHYNYKGELEALNRKYDALLVEVLSTKETVGLMRIDSDIKIKKIAKQE